jgi:peroxiredoxin
LARDFLNNELQVGDEVVFMRVKYRGLMRGTIKRLSEKTALIVHEKTNLCTTETKQFHDQIIKIIK